MTQHSFAHLPPTAANHFSLYFYAAVQRLFANAIRICGSWETLLEHCPFLAGYDAQLAAHAPGTPHDTPWWQATIHTWENQTAEHLPLRALRDEAGLSHESLLLLITTGLAEEDARFGMLFEALGGIPGQASPTLGLLTAWWDADDPGAVRAALRQLRTLGLIEVSNPSSPRSEWLLRPYPLIWDALRGEMLDSDLAWLRYDPPESLATLDTLIVPATLRQAIASLPELLQSDAAHSVIVRGPGANGRRTLLGAVARAIGRGRLAMNAPPSLADGRWHMIGPLALLLHALPVIALDLMPGETVELPALPGYNGPLGLALGMHGGVHGPRIEQAITLALPLPNPAARREHWRRALGAQPDDTIACLGERFRMTGGNIRRAAKLARTYAALAGRTTITTADVQQASRALNRQTLDTVASHMPTGGDWNSLSVAPTTLCELHDLERRCRNRERLHTAVGTAMRQQLNCGVRALFGGPSGAGKTLAAHLLAAALQKDLYRLDLAAVVNKYIGETEKSLSQMFARAEELDVVLLIDEGDALLTRRTDVQSSNDRYANLETNYLLQRLETFEGILIITTNAMGRIDSAFQRRMDVVITFHSPRSAERAAIWRLHLPTEHAVDAGFLEEVAALCNLSGGQICNAVLHAALLALDEDHLIGTRHLTTAIEREYRKLGELCPLEYSVSEGV